MQDPRLHPLRWLACAWLVAALAACGGAAKSAGSAPQPSQAKPGQPGQPATSGTEPTPSAAPKGRKSRGLSLGEDDDDEEPDVAPSSAKPLSSLDDAEEEMEEAIALMGKSTSGDATAMTAGSGQCKSACQALTSMRRAVKGICKYDKGGDRCKKARGTLSDNEKKVAGTACGC